ncbi:hypothetical protein D3C78_1942230 [compost metagenome]
MISSRSISGVSVMAVSVYRVETNYISPPDDMRLFEPIMKIDQLDSKSPCAQLG